MGNFFARVFHLKLVHFVGCIAYFNKMWKKNPPQNKTETFAIGCLNAEHILPVAQPAGLTAGRGDCLKGQHEVFARSLKWPLGRFTERPSLMRSHQPFNSQPVKQWRWSIHKWDRCIEGRCSVCLENWKRSLLTDWLLTIDREALKMEGRKKEMKRIEK